VLVVQRKEGTWDPPGGRLTPGEDFGQAAVREAYEETGLLVAPQAILATWVGEHPEGVPLATVTYLGYAGDGEVRLSAEHEDYLWATPEEWLEIPSWWSRENRARVRDFLPAEPVDPPEPPPVRGDAERVWANLGAGTVLVDLGGEEPRALLLRRRKSPVGLWENPGGMLEEGEDFVACARRETLEETGLEAGPGFAWWARIEPWRGPDDRDLYAGVGFVSPHPDGEVVLEDEAHDDLLWVAEEEWRRLPTWYTQAESDVLWRTVGRMAR